jgi:adenosylmethionine-8-amino-7-oxononanoate aminotransferase
MLGPPFIINGEDIDLLVDVLTESIHAAVASTA